MVCAELVLVLLEELRLLRTVLAVGLQPQCRINQLNYWFILHALTFFPSFIVLTPFETEGLK